MAKQALIPLIMLLINIILGSTGQVLMKMGTLKMGAVKDANNISAGIWNTFINIFTNPHIIIGLALYAVSAVIWLRILRQVALSFAYPMMSFSYVVVVLLSSLLLGERIPTITIFGLVCITAGVSLIGLGYGLGR